MTRRVLRGGRGLVLVLVLCLVGLDARPGRAQAPGALSADDQAALLLNTGRRASNEKNYPLAIERFRDYLKRFGGNKDALAARFGLGLALLDAPQKDDKAAIEALQPVAATADFPDRPLALYYLALAHRDLGHQVLAQGVGKPNELPRLRKESAPAFETAARLFGEAAAGFVARGKPGADAANVTPDQEWTARARCDQAEMLLRLDRIREAQALVAPFDKDPVLSKTKARALALYEHGYASVLLDEPNVAGRSLSQLAPFDDPVFGIHARYLLGRAHHLAGERPEANAHYQAVVEGYDREKKAAEQVLRDQAQLKNQPEERARLDAFVRSAPDHVARAAFFLGILLYEEERTSEALARFAAHAQQYPATPFAVEATLRKGMCQARMKQFNEAIGTLQPLTGHPTLADQALLWQGRARIGVTNPKDDPAQALKPALADLARAVALAQQAIPTDPRAKARRAEALIELAAAQALAKQPPEAAKVYRQVLQDETDPARLQEAWHGLAAALTLAGQFAESDEAAARFLKDYPTSTLRPAVLLRRAENALLAVPATPGADPAPKLNEAAKRFEETIAADPDAPGANLARQGLASALYKLGEYEKVIPVLRAIPESDRIDDLVTVPYVLADCLLHTMPVAAEDALSAARLLKQLDEALKLLDGFIAGQATHPSVPDALLKLGACHQRRAALMAEAPERNAALTVARQAYERIGQQFGKSAAVPFAAFERANCLARAGDVNGAINELSRFKSDPLRAAPLAPLALIRLSALLRSENKAAEAVTILTEARPRLEPGLLKGPGRAAWAAALQLQHGLALRESGKVAEARTLFESAAKQFPDTVEGGEAAWRAGQCRAALARAILDGPPPGLKPEEVRAANDARRAAVQDLRDVARRFEEQATALSSRENSGDLRFRLAFDAAGLLGTIAGTEEGTTRAVTEVKAQALLKALIDDAGDLPLADEARVTLATLHLRRAEYDPAVGLLNEVLDKTPTPDLAERVRLTLGDCLLAKGDPREALAQYDVVVKNPKSPVAAEARDRAGEALIRLGDWRKAMEVLAPFRDQGPFQNIANISDRALLRLGEACARAEQWDPSRQSLEALVSRFPKSAWVSEARYGIGWARQKQGQHDAAVDAYSQVTRETVAEVAARAQLQIGLCRLEQKRHQEAVNALLVVPTAYNYPDLSALALCEASRAFVELKQPNEAGKALRRVLTEHAQSPYIKLARQRLDELKL